MLNIERYKNELKKHDGSLDCDIYRIRGKCKKAESGFCSSNPCSVCREDNIEWLCSECQLLDDAEKRYLKGVIRPFKNKVKSIAKLTDSVCPKEYICISIEESAYAILPRFGKGTMYQGMEESRRYTLEELGL